MNFNELNHELSKTCVNSKLNEAQRTRSENEITNLSDGYRLRKVNMPTSQTQKYNQKVNHVFNRNSKEELGTFKKVEDLKAICPNVEHNVYQHQKNPPTLSMISVLNSNMPLELFQASPYNIMSDPVISEQFKKLYEEDEYFQNVHKKCVDWLKKSVFAEYNDFNNV